MRRKKTQYTEVPALPITVTGLQELFRLREKEQAQQLEVLIQRIIYLEAKIRTLECELKLERRTKDDH